MSAPRQVLAGQLYMLTRRCTQRQFLLRPDDVTNATFAYCLAEAALRFHIVIIMSLAMSNHHHTVLLDPEGNVSKFMEHFHKMFAKAQNAHLGHWENLWAAEEPCLVELPDTEDVMAKLLYVAMNPVKADLVSSSAEWPGFNGLEAFLSGKPIVTRRPSHFFSEDGPMPETVELAMVVPPQLGDADAIRAKLGELVAAAEAHYAFVRRSRRKRVLGAAAVRNQSPFSSPTTLEPRRERRPRVAARWLWRRIAVLKRNHAFQVAYRIAYRAWRAGDRTVVFPVGTYWLARFAGVQVAAAENR